MIPGFFSCQSTNLFQDGTAFLFTNHLVPDAHLLPGSPAIGSGPNGSDMGIYGTDDAINSGEPASPTSRTNAQLWVAGLDLGGYKYRLVGTGFTNGWSPEQQTLKYIPAITLAGATATATSPGHGFSSGDGIEVTGADSLCPYYNGVFTIRNVTANTFDYTVAAGTNLLTAEPLTITWPIRNEARTDIWGRILQPIEVTGLSNGTYWVEVVRMNSMNVWQSTNAPTVSKTWTVQTSLAPRITGIAAESGAVRLSFEAQGNQSYSILYRDSFDPAHPWQKLIGADVAAGSAHAVVTVTNAPVLVPTRYYRIVTPAQP